MKIHDQYTRIWKSDWKYLIVLDALIGGVRDQFTGRIVVTSDHGELLSEYDLYMHPHYELPELCVAHGSKLKV